MKNLKTYILLIGILLLSACDSNSPLETEPPELVVVEAFLYANEPVENIRLTFMQPLDVEEGVDALPVNDATIKLMKNGQSFELEASAGDSGYYHYSGNDLTVVATDEFGIEVEYNDALITAQTNVPEAPESVALESTTMRVPTIEDIRGGTIDVSALLITVSWENTISDLFYVTVENLETNPTPVNSDFGDGFRGRRIFPPTRLDEFILNPLQFTHYGTHRVKVYHVNQEYADLYETQDQDSRNLNEPLTNIENGLGIFSAFHSDTVNLLLEVVPY